MRGHHISWLTVDVDVDVDGKSVRASGWFGSSVLFLCQRHISLMSFILGGEKMVTSIVGSTSHE